MNFILNQNIIWGVIIIAIVFIIIKLAQRAINKYTPITDQDISVTTITPTPKKSTSPSPQPKPIIQQPIIHHTTNKNHISAIIAAVDFVTKGKGNIIQIQQENASCNSTKNKKHMAAIIAAVESVTQGKGNVLTIQKI